MLANHSSEYPDGYLDKETFKSFFGITGESGAFNYQPGYERIPGMFRVSFARCLVVSSVEAPFTQATVSTSLCALSLKWGSPIDTDTFDR